MRLLFQHYLNIIVYKESWNILRFLFVQFIPFVSVLFHRLLLVAFPWHTLIPLWERAYEVSVTDSRFCGVRPCVSAAGTCRPMSAPLRTCSAREAGRLRANTLSQGAGGCQAGKAAQAEKEPGDRPVSAGPAGCHSLERRGPDCVSLRVWRLRARFSSFQLTRASCFHAACPVPPEESWMEWSPWIMFLLFVSIHTANVSVFHYFKLKSD